MARQCVEKILSCLRKGFFERGKCQDKAFTFRENVTQDSGLLCLIFIFQSSEARPVIVNSPPELLGCESVELVCQAPVYTDYAIRLEAVLVDVVRERIDFRRPPRIIMRVGSEMGKISCGVMDVDDKQTDGCTANKKHLNPAKLFRRGLGV